MPASYTPGLGGQAIAYGYQRPTALTDADLLQDLGLMHAAGFNLVRTYVADAVTQRLFTLAAASYPQMRFQLGTGIGGTVCDSSDNIRLRDAAIAQARAHANVVAVSVANEAWQLTSTCLAGHAAVLRSQVTQPLTYNDIVLFWSGQWTPGAPDPLLPVIDFVSVHTYPFLELAGWDWRQTAVPAGPARAAAMMDASMVYTKAMYSWLGRATFRTATGGTAHLAASLPLVIGETGWKARQTNPDNAIEAHAARPVNQKWYSDLLRQWETTGGGPKVFYFVAFDEAWKGTDDGWGLWDAGRQPRYSLCGLSVLAAPACNTDLYAGAGYFN
jgi:exo-beta-1,3-glucanase (GH17 family)